MSKEGDIRTARTAWCTARAPRLGFYQSFPAFFTFFQGVLAVLNALVSRFGVLLLGVPKPRK